MQIKALADNDIVIAAPLVAAFRVELKSYKGIISSPDINAASEELKEYLDAKFPIYVVEDNGNYVGYIVCRVDKPTVWVESIFVADEYRRKGIASQLFAMAEQLALTLGENTVYNYVHPNNTKMISFLQKHGYSVLNLIEIRKPYPGEKLTRKIRVDGNEFDY